jgi:beta-mannosidase
VPEGTSTVELSVDDILIEDESELWWPNGHGPATLHKLSLVVDGGEDESQQWAKKFGLRSVELIQEPIPDQEGLGMYFRINNIPVFIKGANWIPMDQFEPRISLAKMDSVLEAGKEAGFNMLRIWGGGMYETDNFYDLADAKGIMLWEEGKVRQCVSQLEKKTLLNAC